MLTQWTDRPCNNTSTSEKAGITCSNDRVVSIALTAFLRVLLEDQIPTNLGPRFNATSFIGNKDLFGYPLPPPLGRSLTVPEIVGIGLGSGLFSLIVSSTAVYIWLRVSEQGYAAQEGKIPQLVSES